MLMAPTDYIEQVAWKFAKTMPQYPHWYTIRWDKPELDDMFCWFAQHIREVGYVEKFKGRNYTLLAIGEWKYWTMGAPIRLMNEIPRIQNTFVLNRAKVENVYT